MFRVTLFHKHLGFSSVNQASFGSRYLVKCCFALCDLKLHKYVKLVIASCTLNRHRGLAHFPVVAVSNKIIPGDLLIIYKYGCSGLLFSSVILH